VGGITREEGAEVDHGVGEGSGVEDLPGIDLVGPELVGGLHPRRRRRRRLLKREEEARGLRQGVKEARRRSDCDSASASPERKARQAQSTVVGFEVKWA